MSSLRNNPSNQLDHSSQMGMPMPSAASDTRPKSAAYYAAKAEEAKDGAIQARAPPKRVSAPLTQLELNPQEAPVDKINPKKKGGKRKAPLSAREQTVKAFVHFVDGNCGNGDGSMDQRELQEVGSLPCLGTPVWMSTNMNCRSLYTHIQHLPEFYVQAFRFMHRRLNKTALAERKNGFAALMRMVDAITKFYGTKVGHIYVLVSVCKEQNTWDASHTHT